MDMVAVTSKYITFFDKIFTFCLTSFYSQIK